MSIVYNVYAGNQLSWPETCRLAMGLSALSWALIGLAGYGVYTMF